MAITYLKIRRLDLKPFHDNPRLCTAGPFDNFKNLCLGFIQRKTAAALLGKGLGAVNCLRIARASRRKQIHITIFTQGLPVMFPLFDLIDGFLTSLTIHFFLLKTRIII